MDNPRCQSLAFFAALSFLQCFPLTSGRDPGKQIVLAQGPHVTNQQKDILFLRNCCLLKDVTLKLRSFGNDCLVSLTSAGGIWILKPEQIC
jgi:hypothetical protein